MKDRVTELKVDGHTNISGTNAVGKTTLQRLLPLFWGERPSNIQRKNKVKDPIPLFYLPRDSSLLIYEYIRGTGQVCQVLVCSDPTREKLQYRFVGKPYSEADYGVRIEDKYKPGSVRDIGSNLRHKGIECSELLSSVQDYRAVIQNDRQYLRKNSKSRSNLSGLAHSFSMCEFNESLVHMEKIVTAILSKHGKLDAMRQMVAQIIQENSQAFEAPRIDSTALQIMTDDIAMLQAFKSNQKQFDDLIGFGAEFKELILSICTHKSQILDMRPLLENSIKLCKSEAEGFSEAKAKLRDQWEASRGELIQDRQEKESQKETTKNRTDRIHEKRGWWSEQNIKTLKADVDTLPIKRESKQNAEERRTCLLEEVAADELKLESKKRKTLETFDKQQEKKQSQLKGHEAKLRNEESASNDNKMKLERENHAAINEMKDKYRDELSDCKGIIDALTVQVKTTNKTQEEESHLLTVESNLADAKNTHSSFNDELLSLVTKRSTFVSDRSEVGGKYLKLSREYDELGDKIHELSTSAYPPAGSLHAFLDESVADWKDGIGRVIEPDLLHRTDLAPSISDSGVSREMFGISLCVNAISTPPLLAEKERLVIMINEKEAALASLKGKREEVEVLFKKINSSIEQADRDINLLDSRIKTAKSDIASCDNFLDMAKFEIQQEVERRKQEIIKKCDIQKKILNDIVVKHSEALDLVEDQARDQKVHELERWQGVRETIEADIDAVKGSLSSLTQQKNERIKELNQDFKAALSKKGIDDQIVFNLNQTIGALSEEITNTENRKMLIGEFEEWQRDIWEIELPRKNTEVADLSKAITIINVDIEKADKNFKQQSAIINTQQSTCEGKYRDYSGEMERLNRIQREWGGFDRTVVTELEFSLSNIRQSLNEAQSKLSQFNTRYREIGEHIDSISSIISLKGNAAITGAWGKLREEAQSSVSGLSDGQTYKRHAYIVERLPRLVHDQIAHVENLQKSQAQRYGDQFKKLHDTLIGYHRMIDIESKNLKAVISENLDLDGINNAEIGLKSRIKELGYWGALEELVKIFEEWKDTGFIDLPSDDFLSSLSEMKNLLHKITGNIQLDTIFDLFIKIEENGRPMIITSDALLDDLSSNGMKYLILCKLYMGFTKMLNESRRSVIHWPIDELGELHGDNISKLFQMLNKNNVVMVGALPQPGRHLLGMFSNKYMIDKDTKQLQTFVYDESAFNRKIEALKRQATSGDLRGEG